MLVLLIILSTVSVPAHSRAQDDPPRAAAEVQYATAGVPTPIMLRFPGGVPPYTHEVTGAWHGRIRTVSGTVLIYTPDIDFRGTDHFTYIIFDATGSTFSQRVDLHVTPPIPYALDVFAAASNTPPPNTPRAPTQVPEEWIVRYDTESATRAAVAALIRDVQGSIIDEIPQLHAAVVTLPDEDAVYLLRARPEIARVEPNLLRTIAVLPNDPQRSNQWGLNAIDVYDAWNLARGTGEIIAILDTGVKLTHADLADHIVGGWDFVDDDADASPNTNASNAAHGTHVHGTANAVTNNARGVAGVAWDARSIHARIIGTVGASASDIAASVIWATDNGARVISMSLAGPGWVSIERDAMDYAAAHGVILVAAAGNDNTSTPYYPASYDHVLSVAATKPNNTRADFSNKGHYIDLSAPGKDILSTTLPSGYEHKSGTSMAAPHVAGVAALVWSRGLATTREEVLAALQCSALDLNTAGWDINLGWGLVQAEAAVRYDPTTTTSCLPTVPHDDFDQARVIQQSSFSDVIDTTHATHWQDDPRPCAGWSYRTVWYKYTVPTDARLRIATDGSTYDTVLAAYTGTRGNLKQIACNDDTNGTASSVAFSVQTGDEYYFMIAAKDYEADRGTLHISLHLDYELPSGCHPSPNTGTDAIICSSE